jgi:hypothetical protein
MAPNGYLCAAIQLGCIRREDLLAVSPSFNAYLERHQCRVQKYGVELTPVISVCAPRSSQT